MSLKCFKFYYQIPLSSWNWRGVERDYWITMMIGFFIFFLILCDCSSLTCASVEYVPVNHVCFLELSWTWMCWSFNTKAELLALSCWAEGSNWQNNITTLWVEMMLGPQGLRLSKIYAHQCFRLFIKGSCRDGCYNNMCHLCRCCYIVWVEIRLMSAVV